MRLYYSLNSCSMAVRVLIRELGLVCELELVNLKTKKTTSGLDYLQMNPKGAVPALVLDNGEVLTETAVIMQYLADSMGAKTLLPPIGNFQRYRVLEWLNFITTDLHKSCSPLFAAHIPEEIKSSIFRPVLERKLRIADHLLGKNKYVLGDTFSIADGYLFVVCGWLQRLQIMLSDFQNLSRHFLVVKERPSVIEVLEEDRAMAHA